MRLLLALVIALHGLIHLMGFAKAFKFTAIGRRTQGRGMRRCGVAGG